MVFYLYHYFYVSNYTGLWDPDAALTRYRSGIYAPRILGREIVALVYGGYRAYGIEQPGWFLNPAFGADFDPQFYFAFFSVNLVFWILFCVCLYSLFVRRVEYSGGTRRDGLAQYMTLVTLTASTFFVVVPYDTAAYFFIALGIVAFHADVPFRTTLFTSVMVLGTLNRESQAVVLSYAAVATLYSDPDTHRDSVSKLVVGTLAFLLVYFGIRTLLGGAPGVIHTVELTANLTRNLRQLFVLIWVVWFLVAIDVAPRRDGYPLRPLGLLFVFLLPYLLTTFVGGRVIELRLVIPPVIVSTALLSHLYTDGSYTVRSDLVTSVEEGMTPLLQGRSD